ncbi:MAG: adenine nucleotide alpha hydrolase [Myxococcales bacterium]|nr:adenine nucleotide alpha hydrolase [Myxococcales bacterium]
MRKRAWVSWSSGKDAAWALHVARASEELEIVGLLCTTNEAFARVAMHGVRESVLRAQADAVGLPVHVVPLPWPCSNEDYEARMGAACEAARAAGVGAMVFGDLFLEDVRAYRESRLAETGIEPRFPLWGRDTRALSREMVRSGLRAIVSTVDPRALDRSFAGRTYDDALLDALPEGVDPCFERGEAHTCVVDGPMFRAPLAVRAGEVVERDGFVFADIA